jgi:outer membrane lipoprotein-sorting protein
VSRGARWIAAALGVALLASPAAAADESALGELAPPPPGLDAKELARRADAALRSDRTYSEGRVIVHSPRLAAPRALVFRSWDDRPGRRSFVRILAPAKDAGTGFLMMYPNLWMYVPRVERTMRIPPSMMLQSWMGSDFTNDDLVRGSNTVDDYDHRVLGVAPASEATQGRRAVVLEYRPHEGAPVVWDRIVAWIDAENSAPLRQEFFDEDGDMLRVMRFDRIRHEQGRFVPHRMTLTPVEEPDHLSVIELDKIDFDADFGDDVFTTRHLERPR